MTGGTAAIGFTESPGMPPEYKPQFDIDTPWDGFQQILDDCVANGWAFTGGTVEELAEAAGMTPEVLTATVETYNGTATPDKTHSSARPPSTSWP